MEKKPVDDKTNLAEFEHSKKKIHLNPTIENQQNLNELTDFQFKNHLMTPKKGDQKTDLLELLFVKSYALIESNAKDLKSLIPFLGKNFAIGDKYKKLSEIIKNMKEKNLNENLKL